MYKHSLIENPYRPGAGHAPPYLAGRRNEQDQFLRLLHQPIVTQNILITGLRGFGKTVLLDQMKATAEANNWLWVGNDLSESSALTEERLALRILTDLAQAIATRMEVNSGLGQVSHDRLQHRIEQITRDDGSAFTFDALKAHYEQAAGLPSDRLRSVLMHVTRLAHKVRISGVILGYDEAQCLCDHAERNEFPMSMLIETVSALQKKDGLTPCLLVLCGLPQVFDALIETRTYTERMFQVMTLDRLSKDETRAAVTTPIQKFTSRLHTPPDLIEKVVNLSGGYPYLIQFFGRELVEQLLENGGTLLAEKFPSTGALERLDAGLFSARWNRTTDKQRELLGLIASRPAPSSNDFSARELELMRESDADTSALNFNQMLLGLCDRGLLYRTRHGRYAFTVPMSEAMILRRLRREEDISASWDVKPPSPPPQQPTSSQKQNVNRQKRGWFR
jgi:hypothetical protein